MGSKATLELGSEDRNKLQLIFLRGTDWCERERAQTLIFLDDGLSLKHTATKVGIHVRTGGFTYLDWVARSFESLTDKHCSDAPPKISPTQLSKVLETAHSEPLTAKALLAKYIENWG